MILLLHHLFNFFVISAMIEANRIGPCFNGGYIGTDDKCICVNGHWGPYCRMKDSCGLFKKYYGISCHGHGVCRSVEARIWCECYDGYTGKNCKEAIENYTTTEQTSDVGISTAYQGTRAISNKVYQTNTDINQAYIETSGTTTHLRQEDRTSIFRNPGHGTKPPAELTLQDCAVRCVDDCLGFEYKNTSCRIIESQTEFQDVPPGWKSFRKMMLHNTKPPF